jgi:hypothetical protein
MSWIGMTHVLVSECHIGRMFAHPTFVSANVNQPATGNALGEAAVSAEAEAVQKIALVRPEFRSASKLIWPLFPVQDCTEGFFQKAM